MPQLKKQNLSIILISFGTNDCTDQRYSFNIDELVERYLMCLKILNQDGIITSVLKPPPKAEKRFNDKLNDLWDLFRKQVKKNKQTQHIQMFELTYGHDCLQKDGVHLSAGGRRTLEKFIQT